MTDTRHPVPPSLFVLATVAVAAATVITAVWIAVGVWVIGS
jgi:hypothetical protein